VAQNGVASAITTLRTTPPFTDALVASVRGWRFQSAIEISGPQPGEPPTIEHRTSVDGSVLVIGVFRPPTLNTPTIGTLPKDSGRASAEVPYPLSMSMPPMPPRARDDGTVVVELTIDARGRVAGARVVESARGFDDVALDTARGWTFRPATHDAQPVSSFAYAVFGFRQPVTITSRPR